MSSCVDRDNKLKIFPSDAQQVSSAFDTQEKVMSDEPLDDEDVDGKRLACLV